MSAPTGAGQRIVLTGGAGRIATLIRPILARAGLSVTLIDTRAVGDLAGTESFVALNVHDTDTLAEIIDGSNLVVHLGGLASEAPWKDIVSTNVDGTHSVLEACRGAGVRRVLLGSSSHVIGMRTIAEVRAGRTDPQPDTYYGVSKVTMEALAALYARRFDLLTVSVRIGTVGKRPVDARQLSTWLSPADFVRLVEAVLTTPSTGAHVVWGTSANSRALFPLEPGRAIGFVPQDDAEVFAGDLGDPEPLADDALLGARFTRDDHPVGRRW